MADHASDEAQTRLKQLERMAKLREEGWSEATALSVGGGSRATCYRWLKRYRQSGVKGLENGGREFRDECELACRALGIALYALPPRQPKYNGWVERANGTSRYECYPFYRGR